MTDREAIERADRDAAADAAWHDHLRRQVDRDARTGGAGRTEHYRRRAARPDLTDDRPLRVRLGGHAIVEQWPDWYLRRVVRARRAKAREDFATRTAGQTVPAVWTPRVPADNRRASRTERRRNARRASSRSSGSDDDGPAGDPPSPRRETGR